MLGGGILVKDANQVKEDLLGSVKKMRHGAGKTDQMSESNPSG